MPATPSDHSPDDAVPPEPDDQTPTEPDGAETLTFAGNRSLDSRWWWSPALMIVVGAVVIGYQFGAIMGEGGIWLNWAMVAVGGGVSVAGLVSLRREYAAHRAAQAADTEQGS